MSGAIPGAALVAAELAAVEERLLEESRSDVKLVIDVAHHILGSGGKRFRPLLMLLAARMVGFRRRRELCGYAAGIEFAHTSTLLHDDVIDEADVRRGDVSANRTFGNSASIIVGDFLLFRSFSLMLAGKNLAIVQLMSDVALEMAEGEAYQLAQKRRVNLTLDEYLRIIRSKTALLIEAACQIPALAAGATARDQKALKEFGYRLGLAFQMVDDVLDYSASEAEWGKKVGKDFLEGKTTLPVIIAHQRTDAAGRNRLTELFKKPARTADEFREVLDLFARTGALDEADERARRESAAAAAALAGFKPGPAREALAALAEFVVARRV